MQTLLFSASLCIKFTLLTYTEVLHKHTFSCTLAKSRGPFKRLHKFFWEKTEKSKKFFSGGKSIPEKWVSSVFSSQHRYLSNERFLFIVKLLDFKQYAVCMFQSCVCVTNILSLRVVGSSFLLKSQGWDFIQCFLFAQRMLKIKVLTSIFSFDYKHMPAALRLTSGWKTE